MCICVCVHDHAALSLQKSAPKCLFVSTVVHGFIQTPAFDVIIEKDNIVYSIQMMLCFEATLSHTHPHTHTHTSDLIGVTSRNGIHQPL